jgi:glucose dehydrogenase
LLLLVGCVHRLYVSTSSLAQVGNTLIALDTDKGQVLWQYTPCPLDGEIDVSFVPVASGVVVMYEGPC